jgi:exopolysaccharide biosynthesis protein
VLTNGVTWHHSATRGIEWGALRVAGDGEAWRLRVILARIDPRDVHFALYKALRGDSLGGAWTVESAPGNAVLALDAGQFSYGRPWGLVVRQGREEQPPGRGPLSTAIMFDSDGVVSLIPAQLLKKLRGSSHPEAAFQSYPTLLTDDGDVPAEVRGSRGGIDLEHRDSRLALGELRDGRILIALTRFDGLDGALAVVPFGPTVPEMSAIMGALGCRSAVMLDGGISGQMMIRDSSGTKQTWRGWRMVPMGLVATVR